MIDGEIGGAVITFESNDFNGVIEKNRIRDFNIDENFIIESTREYREYGSINYY